jgi:hypothetical protein
MRDAGSIRRLALVFAALIAGGVAVVGVANIPDDEPDRFCAYGGMILGPPMEFGDLTLWTDIPVNRRRPAGCEDQWIRLDREPDLFLFTEEELSEVDGVMFQDCQISWVDGGRSHADDVGVPCG